MVADGGNVARLHLKRNKKFSSSMRKTLKVSPLTPLGVRVRVGESENSGTGQRPSDPRHPHGAALLPPPFFSESGVGAFSQLSAGYARTCLEFSGLKAGTALLLFLGTLLNKQTAPYPSTPP